MTTKPLATFGSRQRGIVMISSLLLLLVVTIMALSIFRSFGMQEKIAGNVRDKQRALQAAVSTEEYAEWWLVNQTNAQAAVSAGVAQSADVSCTSLVDANAGQGQLCNTSLLVANGLTNGASWPAAVAAGTAVVGVQYTPPGLNYTGSDTNGAVTDIYYARPRFYVADAGEIATGRGEVYQIDAYSYGITSNTMAVVESTVAITCLVCNLGGL